MANDNKNNNGLIESTDAEHTDEMESLDATAGMGDTHFGELETDENTLGIESDAVEDAEVSIDSLRSDIRSRDQHINRLQYEIEQLRSRWSGLESEIQAREEITDDLNAQLSEAQQELTRNKELLWQRDQDADQLQKKLAEQQAILDAFEREVNNVSQTVQVGKTVIEELRETVSSQKAQQQSIADERDAAIDARHRAEQELDGAVHLEETLRTALDEKSAALRLAERRADRLDSELDGIRSALDVGVRTSEASNSAETVALQIGVMADNTNAIRELKTQIARTESYADHLRAQLNDVSATADAEQKNRIQLENSLDGARAQISALTEQLHAERKINTELATEKAAASEKMAEEIRQIRFELDSAQNTIAGQESTNEKIASDLLDNREYKSALEQQLEELKAENEKRVRNLDRELRRAQQLNGDLEHKVENRENAIAALLSELSSRSHTIESLGEIEKVVHEIDGKASDHADDRPDADKDRVARLLIGNIAGQELQFPLFKNRITIGRTAENDIQLKSQLISRRHAVITIEDDNSRVVDWGSRNGVYVNDVRVAEQSLENGDILAIGNAEFRYEERSKR